MQQKPLCYKAGMLSFIPSYVFQTASAGPVPGGGLRGLGAVLLSSPARPTTQQKQGWGRPGLLQALRLAGQRRPRGPHGNTCPLPPGTGRCRPRHQQADSRHAPRLAGNYSPQKALRRAPASQREGGSPLQPRDALPPHYDSQRAVRAARPGAALPAGLRCAPAPVPGGPFPPPA